MAKETEQYSIVDYELFRNILTTLADTYPERLRMSQIPSLVAYGVKNAGRPLCYLRVSAESKSPPEGLIFSVQTAVCQLWPHPPSASPRKTLSPSLMQPSPPVAFPLIGAEPYRRHLGLPRRRL